MATNIDSIAEQFIVRYYNAYDTDRATLAAFYRDSSWLSFEGQQYLGAKSITQKLTSLPLPKIVHKIITFDVQPSDPSVASILVFVDGALSLEGEENPMWFTQAFNLIPDGSSYCIRNDIFRLSTVRA